MHVCIVSYVDTGVFHDTVAFFIEADNVADLDLIGIYPITAVRLACSTMRQIDSIVCLKTIHNKAGTIESIR